MYRVFCSCVGNLSVSDLGSLRCASSPSVGRIRPGSAAWKEDKYYELYELLRDDFELDSRFEEVESKLEFASNIIKCVVLL